MVEAGDSIRDGPESLGIGEEPCKRRAAALAIVAGAVAGGRPAEPGRVPPAGQPGSPSVISVNPTSRVGRKLSPIEQGRVAMEQVYVGIDVSRDRLDVHVHPSGEAFAVGRHSEGLDELIAKLRPLAPVLVAIEATGGFETVAAAALAGAGLPIVVVNPAQVRHYAQALGRRAKTDAIDAQVIARFAAAIRPEPRPLPDAQTALLAEFVTRRRQIVAMLVAERQRERRVSDRRLARSLAPLIKALERELATLDQAIEE